MNRLLLQFAKLNVVRNIAVAFVIALASTLITWVVNWKAQQNQAPPPAAVEPAIKSGEASIDTTVQPASEVKDADYISEVILAPESYDKLVADYVPPPDRTRAYINGVEIDLSKNFSVPVDTDGSYRHLIMVRDDDRRHHIYFFNYGCGCEVQTSPDPYRDAIFAEPLRVAARYATKLCWDCKKLQALLDSKSTEPENAVDNK